MHFDKLYEHITLPMMFSATEYCCGVNARAFWSPTIGAKYRPQTFVGSNIRVWPLSSLSLLEVSTVTTDIKNYFKQKNLITIKLNSVNMSTSHKQTCLLFIQTFQCEFQEIIHLVGISIQLILHKSQPNICTLFWRFANQANHTIDWKKTTVIDRQQDRPTYCT